MATNIVIKPIHEQVSELETKMVLDAFAELKRRDQGELRIAIRVNKTTGVREIVYIGVHEQQSLDRLRKLYQQLFQGPSNGKVEAVRF